MRKGRDLVRLLLVITVTEPPPGTLCIQAGVRDIQIPEPIQNPFHFFDHIPGWPVHPPAHTAACPGFKHPIRRQKRFSGKQRIILHILLRRSRKDGKVGLVSHRGNPKTLVHLPGVYADAVKTVDKERIPCRRVEERDILVRLVANGTTAALKGISLPKGQYLPSLVDRIKPLSKTINHFVREELLPDIKGESPAVSVQTEILFVEDKFLIDPDFPVFSRTNRDPAMLCLYSGFFFG